MSILSSACDFFSKTFVSCAEDIHFPDSLKRVLGSFQVKEIMEHQSHIDGKSDSALSSDKKMQMTRKLEERDILITTSACKKIKFSTIEPSPIPNNSIESSSRNSVNMPASVSSNDSTIDTSKLSQLPKCIHVCSPCVEDPLHISDAIITVSDERCENTIVNSNATAESPHRLLGVIPESTGHNSLFRLSKSPSNFYSDQKPRLKQSKFIKIIDTDKSKSKVNWQQSPNDKEKKAFFKLELTPIKLEEFPKSSPTHQSVNRKLQFPPDEKDLESIYDQETVSLPRNSPDVEILGLDIEPVHDLTAAPAAHQQPSYNQNHLREIELDSVDEFIKNIPLSDIVSPDEMQALQFADIKADDDAVGSEGTGSLMSITSSSVSQSVTPPLSGIEIPPHSQTEAELILAFNECIHASEESAPIDSYQPLVEESVPMEIEDENVETELENNVSTDSIPLDSNTTVLLKDLSPETTAGPSSSHQANTPKQSILKKQSTSSPSPSFKKVSFANPIQETHAISISPRTKKLRTQKQSSTSKLTSATTSIGTRRGARMGATGSSNPEDPICTALLECTESVDMLIPFLTSQSVSRGIVGLLKAKNIETIGDLAKLNEREAETLPIQPPKMLTLRTAFSKYQVTQFGIPGDLTRQLSHPLFFPLTRYDGEMEEDRGEGDQDNVTPVEVAQLPEVEFVDATQAESMGVSIQELPLGEVDTAQELIPTYIQTDPLSSADLVQEIEDTLPRDIQGMSQVQLTLMLRSLCQLIPSIADQLNN